MKHRTIGAATAAVAAAASVLALAAGPASALATVHVDPTGTDTASCGAVGDPCLTIQRGVQNVDAGGTVVVAAGTYAGVTDITKPVTITGAGQGQTIVGLGTRQASGSQAGLFRVRSAGDVTIQDLTIRGAVFSVSGPAYGIYLDSVASTAGRTNTISDVTIEGVGAGGNDYNLYCEDSNADLVIEGSTFTKADNNPLLIEGCTGNVDIVDNVVEKTAGTAPSSAIFSMNNFGRFAHGDVNVDGNVVSGGNVSWVVGFQQLAPGGFGGVSVTDNQVTGGGISLSNQATQANAASAQLRDVVVRGNLLQGTGAGNGVSISGLVPGTAIEGNTISGYANGLREVAAAMPATHQPSGTVALANRIVNNGVAATTVGALDAEDNWWGCNVVASCSTITGAVDVDPALQLAVSASPTTVGLNEPSAITADVTRNSAGDVAPGSFPDGAPVAFSTKLGTVSPASAPLADRVAGASFSSASPGVASVQATLDGQSVVASVTVTAPPPPAPVCKLIKITIGIPALGIKPIVICI